MHALGVDVGYGHTKAVSSLCDRPLTFPSVVGRAEADAYRLDLNGHDQPPLHGGVLTGANDDAYLYGEPAIRYARVTHQPRDRDWIRSQPYRVLWDAVVTELLLPSTHPIIVTGLPVRYYSADRAVLEEVVQQVVQGRNIRPRQVIVVPQPFGSFFAHILDHTGRLAPEQHPTAHRGIIDVGHFTTDCVEVDDCEHIEKGSGSLEVGVATVCDAIRRLAHERWERTLNASECEAVIGGAPVRVKGQDYDLREATQRYCADVAMAIAQYARQLWGGGAALDEVVVTGGGGPLFVDWLRSAFSQLTLLSDAFMANAHGYMQYALYRGQGGRMTARNAPHAPPQRAVSGATRTERARPVRFRLSVHTPRDQAITRWLEGIPLYARAEAIRCILYDHLQGQTASLTEQRASRPSPPSTPPIPSPSAADEDPAATKLRRMF